MRWTPSDSVSVTTAGIPLRHRGNGDNDGEQHDLLEAAEALDGQTGPKSGHLRHALLGSVAEKVVRHVPCPVLVVRSRTDAH